ncbi:ABC transporter permease [bacterium]|nr:ABC transporter permease [bacterium]
MSIRLLLAFKNLGRNRRRNMATASAIVLGYAGLVLLSGFVSRIEKFFRATSIYMNHVGTLSVYKPDGVEKHLLQPKKYSLNRNEQSSVREVAQRIFPQNEGIGASLEGFTLIGNGCKTWPVKINGVETSLEEKLLNHPSVRRYSSEILESRRGSGLWQHQDITPLLVTAKVARNLGKNKLKSPHEALPVNQNSTSNRIECTSENIRIVMAEDSNVQLASRTFNNDFSAIDGEIVGHFSSGLELLEESAALIPLPALQKLFETDGATNMVIYLPWDSDVEPAAQLLDKTLKEAGLNLEVHHFKEFSVNSFYAGFMNLIYVMSTFFLALAVSVVTLTVSDTMTMSVLERSREIGTLRAVGFKQQQVTAMFSQEGALLGSLCIPIGLFLATVTTRIINSSQILFEVPGVSTKVQVVLNIEPLQCTIIACLLISITTLSGWITSWRSSKRQIVKLLQTHVS